MKLRDELFAHYERLQANRNEGTLSRFFYVFHANFLFFNFLS